MRNTSAAEIECLGFLNFGGTSTGYRRARVPIQATTTLVAASNPSRETAPQIRCRPAAGPPKMDIPTDCRHRIVEGAAHNYYPEMSKRLGEEGGIILAYTLPTGNHQSPAQIRVTYSSLYPRLDEAAIRYLRDLRIDSDCAGRPYQMRVNFSLNHR